MSKAIKVLPIAASAVLTTLAAGEALVPTWSGGGLRFQHRWQAGAAHRHRCARGSAIDLTGESITVGTPDIQAAIQLILNN